MAQDFNFKFKETHTQSQMQIQGMKEVLDLLKKYNIDYEVEGDKIMIKGDVQYVDFNLVPEIIITQGDNRIGFDEFMDWNRIVVETSTHVRDVPLSKKVYAKYKYPYLIIHF